MRVRPSLSRPLDLSPSEVEHLAAYLAESLAGWGVPDRLRQSFRAAVEHRLTEVLQDMEEERAADLTSYLNSGLRDGRLPLSLDIDTTEEDEEDERQHQAELPYHPRINPPPDPLRLATPGDRPAARFRMPSTWHRAQARAIGHGLRDRSVLPFDRQEEEGGGKPK